jgi:hypothetical protein
MKKKGSISDAPETTIALGHLLGSGGGQLQLQQQQHSEAVTCICLVEHGEDPDTLEAETIMVATGALDHQVEVDVEIEVEG